MRLTPLPDDEWTERTRSAIGVLLPEHRRNAEGAGNALATLARHPALAEAFLTFSGYVMLRSTLPARLIELVTLRIAHRRGCEYERVHHTRSAAKAGLTAAEIEAAAHGKADDELDLAVLNAVDELEDDSTVSDRTWITLGKHLDDQQRMDLVFTVGAYCLLAMALNTFGVTPE